ncbi:hypothetical protein ACA910_007707 [Epithemia clementina (nom. ined.)]
MRQAYDREKCFNFNKAFETETALDKSATLLSYKAGTEMSQMQDPSNRIKLNYDQILITSRGGVSSIMLRPN